MEGIVRVTAAGPVRIHTYTAPEKGWRANSDLIELVDQIVMVDAPLLKDHAEEVRGLADEIGKPISRIYVSHAHPDHYTGTAFFDAPTYALAVTKETIESGGEAMSAAAYELSGAGEPPAVRGIDHVVEPGSEEIGGAVFRFEAIDDAEAAEQLMIGLPEQSVLIAPDILYKDVHMFLGQQAFDGWKAAIEKLESEAYETIIPGHGAPGGREILTASREYLDVADKAVAEATGPEDLDRRLVAAFPDHGGDAMRRLQNLFLFPES